MSSLRQAAFTGRFQCLGDACEDTCCRGWGMQLDAKTRDRYAAEAPELLDAVTTGEAQYIMKRDPVTDICVKLEGGWCGVHKKYGTDFLGDACHFYPRVTRGLGELRVMTASPSCPEALRLMLRETDAFDYLSAEAGRLPNEMKNYLPEGMGEAGAWSVHQSFMRMALDASVSAEHTLMRLVTAAYALAELPVTEWAGQAAALCAGSDARMQAPVSNPVDPFNLLHGLAGLTLAAKKQENERLRHTISDMERALKSRLDWQGMTIQLDPMSLPAYQTLERNYAAQWKPALQPVLRRYLAAQTAQALLPFAGFGAGADQRAAIIGVRFATVRLALICAAGVQGGVPQEADIVRIVQSISRLLDHLADPDLSLQMYRETGWIIPGRLRSACAVG